MNNISLNIQIIPHHYNDDADLIINDNVYLLSIKELECLSDIRALLSKEPDYIYEAVILLLKEIT
jgi:hypothetical protein